MKSCMVKQRFTHFCDLYSVEVASASSYYKPRGEATLWHVPTFSRNKLLLSQKSKRRTKKFAVKAQKGFDRNRTG